MILTSKTLHQQLIGSRANDFVRFLTWTHVIKVFESMTLQLFQQINSSQIKQYAPRLEQLSLMFSNK